MTIPHLYNKPLHPIQPTRYNFPVCSFGKARVVRHSFQSEWFNKYSWLHYDEPLYAAFCHGCVTALNTNMVSSKQMDASFVAKGFTNWKDTTSKEMGMHQHHRSDSHRESIERLITIGPVTKDIGEQLSNERELEKEVNRSNLLHMLTSLKYLCSQGLAVRGSQPERSNLIQLLELRGRDHPRLLEWVDKRTNTYLSQEIQNEMSLMANESSQGNHNLFETLCMFV